MHVNGNKNKRPTEYGEFKCPQCNRVFTTAKGLHSHIPQVHDEDVKRKISEAISRSWQKEGAKERRVKATSDGRKTSRKYQLAECKCHICNDVFKNEHALNIHIASHKRTEEDRKRIAKTIYEIKKANGWFEENAICPECGRELKNKIGLQEHMTFFHSERSEDIRTGMSNKLRKKIVPKETKDKISKALKGKPFSEERKRRISEKTIEGMHKPEHWNKFLNTVQSTEYRNKLSEIFANKVTHDEVHGIKSQETSKTGKIIKCASSYEAWFCRLLNEDDNVKDYDRFRHFIYYNGHHRYVPDFIVEDKDGNKHIIEIKSTYTKTLPGVDAKAEAGMQYAMEHNMTYYMLTELELSEYERRLTSVSTN